MIEALATFRRQRQRSGSPRRRSRRLPRSAVALALGSAALLAAFGLARLADSPLLRIQRVEIRGCQLLSPESVRDLTRPYVGRPILAADIGRLRQDIESQPLVHGATVARRLPDLLEVRINEREPVARIDESPELRLVCAEGVVFVPAEPPREAGSLPVLRGAWRPESGVRIDESGRLGLQALLAYRRAAGGRVPPGTWIDVSHSGRIALSPEGEATLWLDREQPARNLDRLLALRESHDQLARAAVIDLRFPDRLTVVRAADATEGR